MKLVLISVGTRTVLWTRMILRVVTGVSRVLVFVMWVVTVMSMVSILVVVNVVVYRSVTVVVETFSEKVFATKVEEATRMRKIRNTRVIR
ncbi:MAG: hypothetical protein QXF21_01950 [Thermoproteota archaeon]